MIVWFQRFVVGVVCSCVAGGAALAGAGTGNVLTNGDFSAGSTGWRFYSNGVTSFSIDAGEARVAITSPGSNVQLHQRDLTIAGNTDYRLRFRALSTTAADVVVRLLRHTAPYDGYGLTQWIRLDATARVYEVAFRTPPGDKTDARLMFWMADESGTFRFDDVVLEAVDQDCGNGSLDPGEACDDGNTDAGDGCSAACDTEVCGNGVTDPGEACDDGNTNGGDGCSAACDTEVCGNGVTDPGEACDDGNGVDDDTCANDCTANVAGDPSTNLLANGDFSAGEAPWIFYTNGGGRYDVAGGEARLRFTADGTNVQLYQRGVAAASLTPHTLTFRARHSLAGKSVTVRFARHTAPYTLYGLSERITLTTSMQTYSFDFTTSSDVITDGRLMFLVKSADTPGSTIHVDDVVLAPAMSTTCGDGRIESGEACDGTDLGGATCATQGFDGGALACSTDCTALVTTDCFGCGDGTADDGEVCDGADLAGETCRTRGFDAGELGCSAGCDAFVTTGCSTCGDGTLAAGEACDDGNLADGDGCDATCTPEVGCGNGIVEPGESCDDGNRTSGDGCSAFCEVEADDGASATNAVANGDFSAGKEAWSFYSNGSASFAVVAGEARVAIGTPGSNVQLYQRSLALEGDTLYRLRFRGRNTGGADVRVRLQRHGPPYDDYGFDRSYVLTPAEQAFAAEFRTTPGDKTDARLMFFLANERHTFHFDDVAIEKVADLVDDGSPPGVPADVTATALSSTTVRLTWSEAADDVGVAGYRVLRDGDAVATVAATAYDDTGLAPSTPYAYAVTSFDAAGNESPASAVATTTTPPPDTVAPTPPAALSARVISSTRIDLTWNASTDDTGVAGYRVERHGRVVAVTTATAWDDVGLLPGTPYDYTVVAFDAEGNASPPATAAATTTDDPLATIIDLWYGDVQTFGRPGTPQNWINVLGNATDPTGLRELSFSLNGGAERPLTIGPDGLRLAKPGDFNVEIYVGDLVDGINTILIRGVDDQSNVTERSVVVHFDAGGHWPLPYAVDWSSVANLQDAVQVVDGLWGVEPDGVRSLQRGYDRLIAIGDRNWNDYEVRYSFTVHANNTGGTGIILGWTGHTDSPLVCPQPHCGWRPNGNSVWYRWSGTGGEPHDFGGTLEDPTGRRLDPGVRYHVRVRGETQPDGAKLYAFKIWAGGEGEPADWTDTGFGDPQAPRGSLLLIAHALDMTFHDITVVPLP